VSPISFSRKEWVFPKESGVAKDQWFLGASFVKEEVEAM
jgi:hypothetical protein